MPAPIAFYLLAAIILISSVMVVTQRNILHAGLSLILCFWAVAGVYLILDAPFLAVVQVLIYVGAISVLLLFAIMLTHRISSLEGRGSTRALWAALWTSGFVGLSVAMIVRTPSMNVAVPLGAVPGLIELAEGFLDPNRSLLPFELVGILLLVALVGAVIIARKDEKLETPKTITAVIVQPTGADGSSPPAVSALEGTKTS